MTDMLREEFKTNVGCAAIGPLRFIHSLLIKHTIKENWQ